MADTESSILRQYYKEKDFISSPDGILKVLSVLACIVVGVLALSTQQACARAPALASSAGVVALASSAVLALLTAAALLAAPLRAPVLWLYTDVISSSVIGVLLVVAVILGSIFCQLNSAILFVYFVLGLVTAVMTTGSAAVGYAAAMRRTDAASRSRHLPTEPHRRPRAPYEHDV